ncbi:MAG: AcrB/AcrD/AcrF family protein, partial [Cyanobacteria bacterium J083]
MLTLAVIVIGVFFLLGLQVDLLPAITYPRIGVRVDAPGISPEILVEEITKPLEQALSTTEGIVQVYSSTREGRVRINLYFEPGGKIEQALNDATASLNRVRSRLPDIAEEPRIFKFDPSQQPVYEFAVESPNLDAVGLRIFAEEELSRELAIVPGVAAVDVAGGLQEEVRVEVNAKRLQGLGISLKQILTALEKRNQDIAGGRLPGEIGEPTTRTIGRWQKAEEIKNLRLEIDKNNNDLSFANRRVRLGDIAQVIDGTQEQRLFVTLNGKSAVKVSLQKQPDANTITTINRVKRRLQELRETGTIDPSIKLVPTLDESIVISQSIKNVTNAGIWGTGLAAIAVLLFLGSWRQTLIIVLSIPLAILTGIIGMKLFALSLNIFS